MSDNPLQAAAAWTDERDDPYAPLSPLDRFLSEQRRKNNQPEPLPGITSGPPPKPWGLDRNQLPQPPAPVYGQSGFIANTLNRVRPMDNTVDPYMNMQPQQSLRPFKLPGGGMVYLPSPGWTEQSQQSSPEQLNIPWWILRAGRDQGT